MIILAVCFLSDMLILVGIVTCLSTKKYYELIVYAACLALVFVAKILSTFLTYDIILEYGQGRLKATKKYPFKVIELFCEDITISNIEKYSKGVEYGKKCVALCSKCCVDEVYVIDFNGKKYLINIDDYMYSLIEVNSDIS